MQELFQFYYTLGGLAMPLTPTLPMASAPLPIPCALVSAATLLVSFGHSFTHCTPEHTSACISLQTTKIIS